jgi:hypothetical protein
MTHQFLNRRGQASTISPLRRQVITPKAQVLLILWSFTKTSHHARSASHPYPLNPLQGQVITPKARVIPVL